MSFDILNGFFYKNTLKLKSEEIGITGCSELKLRCFNLLITFHIDIIDRFYFLIQISFAFKKFL